MIINPKLRRTIFISLIPVLFMISGNVFAKKLNRDLYNLEQAGRNQKCQLDMSQYYIEKSVDLLLFDIYTIRDLSANKQAFETNVKELKELKKEWFDSYLKLWREYSAKRQELMKKLPKKKNTLKPELAKKLQGESDIILAGLDKVLKERRKKFDAEFIPLKNKINLLLKKAREKFNLKADKDLPVKTYTSNAEWLRNNYLLSVHNASQWVFNDIGVRDTIRYLGYLGIDLLENNAYMKIHDAATKKRTEAYYNKLEPDLERFCIRQIFWPVARHGPYPPEIGPCLPFREWSIFAPETFTYRKRQIDYAFKLFKKYPSFAGFQLDEVCSENKFLYEQAFPSKKHPKIQTRQISLFTKYLEKKYDGAKLKELGLTGDKIRIPVYRDKKKNKVLWMEYQEFISDTDTQYWKQVYDYAHQLKPDCVVWMLMNAFWYAQNPFLHRWSRRTPNAEVVDLAYWIKGSPSLSCFLDLLGANAQGPASYTPNPTRGGSAETLRREFAISTVHARANHFFTLSSFFMNSSKTFLKSTRRTPCDSAILVWRTLVEHCKRIGKIQKYLIHTRSAWPVALVFSERSAVTGPSLAHFDNYLGLYRALAEKQIGFDAVFADSITPGQLKKYKVVILSDASTLRKEHIDTIRGWVAGGGFLITSGYSTLCDRWGRALKNYQLHKVFGVDFIKLLGHRKPFFRMPMKGPYPVLCNMHQYDIVRPVTAEVRWKWETGEPAVTFNKYEKGACIFLSSRFPGRSIEPPEGAMIRGPRTHKYLKGFKQLLAESVLEGLKRNNAPFPLTAVKCPSYVELNLKIQEKPSRKIIQLINHSLDVSPVKGVELSLPMDKNGKAPKVFYGEDGTPVRVRSADGSLVLSVRDLDVYDMVVIEP